MILQRQQHGPVQVLTLNRPEAANSLDPALLQELATAFREVADDDGTQVAVVTGTGERVFCAGMDLRAFSRSRTEHGGSEAGASDGEATPGPSPAGRPAAGADPTEMFRNLCPKPVVAAVNGAAVGGGFELVLACDLVVAAEHARFGLPEVRRGLLAGGGGTLLGTRIPLPLALEVALTGELVDAARAERWGLVNRVVPAPDLLDASLALAATVAANGPLALRTTKLLVRRAVLDDPGRGWGSPEELAAVFGSEDAREGAAAFVEKRPPRWQGR